MEWKQPANPFTHKHFYSLVACLWFISIIYYMTSSSIEHCIYDYDYDG